MFLSPKYRGSKGLFDGPATGIKALGYGGALNAGNFYPFCEAERFAVKLKNAVSACVSSLALRCSPPAIIGYITSIIVNALNRKIVAGTFSHVREKVLKRISPSRTHLNTTPSIVSVSWVIGIMTSLLYSLPRAISSRAGISMLKLLGSHRLSAQTSTTVSLARSQIFLLDVLFNATVTSAEPRVLKSALPSGTLFEWTQNKQFAKSLVCEIHNIFPQKRVSLLYHECQYVSRIRSKNP